MTTTPPTHATLPSGDKIPLIGLGCWQSEPEALSQAVAHAIKAGYRHIDGATIYGNEKALGEGIIQSGVERRDIWVTTKLWNDVMEACKRSLDLLGLDYIDLWLMHYPAATDTNGDTITVVEIPYTETWKAMEACVDAGLLQNRAGESLVQLPNQTSRSPNRKTPIPPSKRFHEIPQRGNTNPSFADRDPLPPIQKNPAVQALAEKYGISPANVLISLQLSSLPLGSRRTYMPYSFLPRTSSLFPTLHKVNEQDTATLAISYYAGLDDSD
ncbi:uncharacterized protein IL334_007955 [Kwoniella shivajii]|uniref:NADP-dependent oxidoreductase domain-containing protein n=1 Tax=Kwoniella shivajii TaxID=564305 RepID=A0ABZ1DD77_9TREE|nr:hypothetical protein IL334_007955 [Kwoniella shivajii]